MDIEQIEAAGFAAAEDLQAAHEQTATDLGMHTGGQYVVQGVWRKGAVTILVEQNTGQESMGGLAATVTYPPVCVITGPTGRVACNPDNTDLILQLASELA